MLSTPASSWCYLIRCVIVTLFANNIFTYLITHFDFFTCPITQCEFFCHSVNLKKKNSHIFCLSLTFHLYLYAKYATFCHFIHLAPWVSPTEENTFLLHLQTTRLGRVTVNKNIFLKNPKKRHTTECCCRPRWQIFKYSKNDFEKHSNAKAAAPPHRWTLKRSETCGKWETRVTWMRARKKKKSALVLRKTSAWIRCYLATLCVVIV